MNRELAPELPDVSIVLYTLTSLRGDRYTAAALEDLAQAILCYVQRSRLPLPEAVDKIVTNYERDGARVQQLLDQPTSAEWDAVLEHVIGFASRHSLYPKDTEATSWPDLDAYHDVRRNLHSYNFEGSLDHWVTVTVVNRLRRYWRDQQSLSAGGPGFRKRPDREADDTESDHARPKGGPLSLDRMLESDWSIVGAQASDNVSVAHDVEDAELRRMTAAAVRTLATRRRDDLLPLIWDVVVERGWRLREVAESLGLTISQVHRRIEQTRCYLRRDPAVQQWLHHWE